MTATVSITGQQLNPQSQPLIHLLPASHPLVTHLSPFTIPPACSRFIHPHSIHHSPSYTITHHNIMIDSHTGQCTFKTMLETPLTTNISYLPLWCLCFRLPCSTYNSIPGVSTNGSVNSCPGGMLWIKVASETVPESTLKSEFLTQQLMTGVHM